MYADASKQALRGKMYGDGVGMEADVMGMGWGWGESCGDGVGMGRTSCPHAALYCGVHTRSQIALSSLCEFHIL